MPLGPAAVLSSGTVSWCSRFFELSGREALSSARPSGNAAALAFCFPFAFSDNFFDPLISMSKTLGCFCAGCGVAAAAAGRRFVASAQTAPFRSSSFAPARTAQEISKEMRQQRKACSPGQIDRTSAKKGSSFLPRAARIRSRSASTATLLRTMMTQSSRQSEILSVPARPLVQHRMVCLVPLICFLT